MSCSKEHDLQTIQTIISTVKFKNQKVQKVNPSSRTSPPLHSILQTRIKIMGIYLPRFCSPGSESYRFLNLKTQTHKINFCIQIFFAFTVNSLNHWFILTFILYHFRIFFIFSLFFIFLSSFVPVIFYINYLFCVYFFILFIFLC